MLIGYYRIVNFNYIKIKIKTLWHIQESNNHGYQKYLHEFHALECYILLLTFFKQVS